MLRRLLPLAIALVGVLAACSPSTPALTDPKEIVAKGLEATAKLTSFHLSLSLDGTVKDPSSGTTFPLDGTLITGDVDLANRKLAGTFSVMGFSGEARLIDDATYLKMSLTGPKWVKSSIAPSASRGPLSALDDISASIDQLRAFLNRDGVTSRLVDEASCGDRRCYHVLVTVSPELLDSAGDTVVAAMKPSELFPDGLPLDLFFDREQLYLSRLAIDLTGSKVGDVSAALELTKANEAVAIDAPPADEVTDDGGGFTLP